MIKKVIQVFALFGTLALIAWLLDRCQPEEDNEYRWVDTLREEVRQRDQIVDSIRSASEEVDYEAYRELTHNGSAEREAKVIIKYKRYEGVTDTDTLLSDIYNSAKVLSAKLGR